jgi:mono/diheme cytochrome c family protein
MTWTRTPYGLPHPTWLWSPPQARTRSRTKVGIMAREVADPPRFLPRASPVCVSTLAGMWVVLTLLLEVGSLPLTAALGAVSSEGARGGDPEKGRQVFHGRGICHYCHGQNGDPEHLPELRPETLRTIRGLRPQPPDLRRSEALRLKSDRQRFVIIRDGHEGTGMLPDTTLSNQEIRDVVAYLATLRDTARQTGK